MRHEVYKRTNKINNIVCDIEIIEWGYNNEYVDLYINTRNKLSRKDTINLASSKEFQILINEFRGRIYSIEYNGCSVIGSICPTGKGQLAQMLYKYCDRFGKRIDNHGLSL